MAHTIFSKNFQKMSLKGTPSTDVFSLISDVTDPDEISDDVNAYFQKFISPETG